MSSTGITWHTSVVTPESLTATAGLIKSVFGVAPVVEMEGFAQFRFEDGTMLELVTKENVPPYGYNDGVTFGYRVADVAETSVALEAAGVELLGEITRLSDFDYAYRHFRGPDGRVYGINESKAQN